QVSALSLHDALPIYDVGLEHAREAVVTPEHEPGHETRGDTHHEPPQRGLHGRERHLPEAQANLAGGEIDEAADDGRRPADEERVDPVEPRRAADGLDAGQPLPGAEEREEAAGAHDGDARAPGHPASSSPRTCQTRPYSRAYSSLSRSAMTSRGRSSLTS